MVRIAYPDVAAIVIGHAAGVRGGVGGSEADQPARDDRRLPCRTARQEGDE